MKGDFLGKFTCVSIASLVWLQTKSIIWALVCTAMFTVGWCIVNWNNKEFWDD